ncbi:amino acid ABC transporter ATP-binding protein [Holzapfeliella floricola]|uniref:Amino acid ABC transporter ATP-binding protein n=1 Tax=Holzapfeliella floricola DSM 23037 = JCM 16512 TaxID=1423744 RepID=A0A0R2DWK1_9LACO|nr:amino acid ABC transporter ATP-binding protein [Holzapfeliella floricola]KRN04669.1 amino acid ABC transporter ATP-binding protein [Holzapfeliella floricola DSM 23037 = JCM 16512]
MLSLKDINVSFDQQQVLKDFSADFNENQTTVIVGPSGSGKSTLLRTINLLNYPTSGTLNLNQTSFVFPKQYPAKEVSHYRQNFGMVFQNFELFPHLSALGNVIEGPIQVLKQSKTAATEKAKVLLEQVGLAQKADSFPNELSGGQQQRVAIARALAMEPEFILYDEPTSALDPELEGEVLKVIKDLAKKRNSQIVVTHNLNFAKEIADHILFLEDGQVNYYGLAEGFFSSKNERIKNFTKKMMS